MGHVCAFQHVLHILHLFSGKQIGGVHTFGHVFLDAGNEALKKSKTLFLILDQGVFIGV